MLKVSHRESDESIARRYVNNGREFEDFAMFDETIRDSDNYCIVYTQHRDSDFLTQANAEYIDKAMAEFEDRSVMTSASEIEPMIIGVSCSHWAVGYIEGYAIAVYDRSSASGLSEAFEAMCEISRDYDEYPALDEERWSELESEAEWEYLADLARECERDSDYEIPFTDVLLYEAIRDLDLNFGYGYYGEAYMKAEDLETAAAYAALDTYRDMNCSD